MDGVAILCNVCVLCVYVQAYVLYIILSLLL